MDVRQLRKPTDLGDLFGDAKPTPKKEETKPTAKANIVPVNPVEEY